jgi:hypothetical protein
MKLWFEGCNVNARERIGDQPAPGGGAVARFAINHGAEPARRADSAAEHFNAE